MELKFKEHCNSHSFCNFKIPQNQKISIAILKIPQQLSILPNETTSTPSILHLNSFLNNNPFINNSEIVNPNNLLNNNAEIIINKQDNNSKVVNVNNNYTNDNKEEHNSLKIINDNSCTINIKDNNYINDDREEQDNNNDINNEIINDQKKDVINYLNEIELLIRNELNKLLNEITIDYSSLRDSIDTKFTFILNICNNRLSSLISSYLQKLDCLRSSVPQLRLPSLSHLHNLI